MTEGAAPTPAAPTPAAPTPPAVPTPPASSQAQGGEKPTAPSASNVEPGVDLASGERVDDAADIAKRDARVDELASQYDDPEQRQRVYDRFNDQPEDEQA